MMIEKKIWLDCDGTWIDLYGVDGWLEDIVSHNARPYKVAKPMVNLSHMARVIHKLQANDWEVGIISWLAKNSNEEYDEMVKVAKLEWFAKHMPSVKFDNIYIVPYGMPKSNFGNGYLFDDEEPNRKEWKGIAYNEKDLIKKMASLI